MSPEVDGTINTSALAGVLKALREQQDLSQTAAATAAGIPHYTLNRLEKGVARPAFEDLAPLAKFYGLDLNQVGAILGVWEVEEQAAGIYPPEVLQLCGEIKSASRELPAEEIPIMAALLRSTLQAVMRMGRQRRGEEQATPVEGLPSWIKLRPRK